MAKQSLYTPGQAWGLQEIEAPRFHHIRHIVIRLSVVRTGSLYPLAIIHGTYFCCGPGSSVGMKTDYRLDGPGSNPGGDEIFRSSRPALRHTQPPVQWVPGLSRG